MSAKNYILNLMHKSKHEFDPLAKVYREFAKQKFNTYRLKFPRLKESEITKKILKEWESIDEAERDKLIQAAREESGSPDLNPEKNVVRLKKEPSPPKKKLKGLLKSQKP